MATTVRSSRRSRHSRRDHAETRVPASESPMLPGAATAEARRAQTRGHRRSAASKCREPPRRPGAMGPRGRASRAACLCEAALLRQAARRGAVMDEKPRLRMPVVEAPGGARGKSAATPPVGKPGSKTRPLPRVRHSHSLRHWQLSPWQASSAACAEPDLCLLPSFTRPW